MFENAYNTIQETKTCPVCSRPFTAHPTKRYCSRRCKNKAKTVRTKITELSPQSSVIHQIELLTPTIEEVDLLCKQILLRDDETIYKVKVMPPNWVCPPNITCVHHASESNSAKNYYELSLGSSGFITVTERDVSLERQEAELKKWEEIRHRQYEQEKIARMARVNAAMAAKISPPEELATINLADGTSKENLTLTELDQFRMEHFYNIKDDKLVDDTGEEVGTITYHDKL